MPRRKQLRALLVFGGLAAAAILVFAFVPAKPDLKVEFVCYEGDERSTRLRFENRSSIGSHLHSQPVGLALAELLSAHTLL
jgi:hypothetical protein